MEETRLDVRVGTVVDGRVDVVQTESDARRYELLEDAGRLFYDQHQQLQQLVYAALSTDQVHAKHTTCTLSRKNCCHFCYH